MTEEEISKILAVYDEAMRADEPDLILAPNPNKPGTILITSSGTYELPEMTK